MLMFEAFANEDDDWDDEGNVIGAVIIMLGYKLTDEQAAMYARANAERELSV